MSEPTKQNVWYPVSVEPPIEYCPRDGVVVNNRLLLWRDGVDAIQCPFVRGLWRKIDGEVGQFYDITSNVKLPFTHWMEVGNPNEQEPPASNQQDVLKRLLDNSDVIIVAGDSE